MRKYIIFFAVFVAVVLLGWFLFSQKLSENGFHKTSEKTQENQILYNCKNSKTIVATYRMGTPTETQPGEMPKPNGSVDALLSDGRVLSLPQTISASGVRYANADESIIFWNKGNGAFILENNKETFSDCISVIPDQGGLPNVYTNSAQGFSLRYPQGYTVTENFKTDLSPESSISGVKFTVPDSMRTGTNLASGTGVSVEEIPNIQDCNAARFLSPNQKTTTTTDNGVEYSVGSYSDAGAGNFYEQTVWAFPGTNPCIAIRAFIHSTNIGNYDPGTVKEFDKQALKNQFDAIRKSITLL